MYILYIIIVHVVNQKAIFLEVSPSKILKLTFVGHSQPESHLLAIHKVLNIVLIYKLVQIPITL